MNLVGFFRCGGFDHQIRCVSDAPTNQYGQHYVFYQDGFRVFHGYMYIGDMLNEASLSTDIGGSMRRTERSEWDACQAWCASMAAPQSQSAHALDA